MQLSKDGQYALSGYKNSNGFIMVEPDGGKNENSRMKRVMAITSGKAPGPGHYQVRTNSTSKFSSKGSCVFGSSKRKAIRTTHTSPGPGSYFQHSDFGMMISKVNPEAFKLALSGKHVNNTLNKNLVRPIFH